MNPLYVSTVDSKNIRQHIIYERLLYVFSLTTFQHNEEKTMSKIGIEIDGHFDDEDFAAASTANTAGNTHQNTGGNGGGNTRNQAGENEDVFRSLRGTRLRSSQPINDEVLAVFKPLIINFNDGRLSGGYGFKLEVGLFAMEPAIPAIVVYTRSSNQIVYSVLLLEHFLKPNYDAKQIIPVHGREPIRIEYKTCEYFDTKYNTSVRRWLSSATEIPYDSSNPATDGNFILASRAVIQGLPTRTEDYEQYIMSCIGAIYRAIGVSRRNVKPWWKASKINPDEDILTASFSFNERNIPSAENTLIDTSFVGILTVRDKRTQWQRVSANDVGGEAALAGIAGSIDVIYNQPPQISYAMRPQELNYKPFTPVIVIKEIIPHRSDLSYHPDIMMVLLGLAMARKLIKTWPLAFPAGSEGLRQLGHLPMLQFFTPEQPPMESPVEILQHRDPNAHRQDMQTFVQDYFKTAIIAVDVVDGGAFEWLLGIIFDKASHNSFGKGPGGNSQYMAVLDALEKFSETNVSFNQPFNLAHKHPIKEGELWFNNYAEVLRGYYQGAGGTKEPLDGIDALSMIAALAGNNAHNEDLQGFLYSRTPLEDENDALLFNVGTKELIKHTKPTTVIQNTVRRHFITGAMLDLIDTVLGRCGLPIDTEGLSMTSSGIDYGRAGLDESQFGINGSDSAFAGSRRGNGNAYNYRKGGGLYEF